MRTLLSPLFSSTLALATVTVLLTATASSYAEEHETSSSGSKSITKDSSHIKKIDDSNEIDTNPRPKNKSSAKAAAAQHDKEEVEADQLAAKIAAKIADIRKENEHLNPVPPLHPAKKRVRPSSSAAMIDYGQTPGQSKVKIMPHGAMLAADALLMPSRPIYWSYEGDGGPLRWSKIDAANAKCDTGERQSPIDIRNGIHVDLEPIGFDYKPTRFNVNDTGHTIQVNLSAGNAITLMGRRYELTQFNFHKPAEEHVDGHTFPMSVDLVHRDDEGKLAVISVLIDTGKANALIQTIWNDLPLEKNQTTQPTGMIDVTQLLPLNKQYYTYMGSLTTPPCTEGVLWMVFKDPIEVTQEQISIFGRLYPMNARPVQNDSGRLIKESN